MAQDDRLRLGIQLQKESIENALQFTRYDQMKVRIVWKVQKLKLMMLLDVWSQQEHVGRRITRLEITDQKIQVIQHSIESA